MTTLTLQDIITNEAAQFAKFLCAFRECDPEMQNVILEMAEIIADPETDEEDREHATDALMEALAPGIARDTIEAFDKAMRSEAAVRAHRDLDREEAGFADRVRSLMEEAGLTQEDLAQRTGVGQPAISNILNRQCRPQRRTVARFAEALGVPPEELWP